MNFSAVKVFRVKMRLLYIGFILALAVFSFAQNTHDPNYCYAYDSIRPQQPRWSDRTSNENVRGSSINSQVSSCTPARFWFYMRHGDRLPSINDITRMRPFSVDVSELIVHKNNPLMILLLFSKLQTLSMPTIKVEETFAIQILTLLGMVVESKHYRRTCTVLNCFWMEHCQKYRKSLSSSIPINFTKNLRQKSFPISSYRSTKNTSHCQSLCRWSFW